MGDEHKATTRTAAWAPVIAALGYFLTQEASFNFPDASKVVMAVWPAAGVGLASFLLVPKRRWPLLAIAIFLAGNLANLLQGRPVSISLAFMAVNLLESSVSALVVLAMCGGVPRFGRSIEVTALAAAAIGVNALTALPAALVAHFVSGSPFGAEWLSWWISDGLGILIIAPLILTWSRLEDIGDFLKPASLAEILAFAALWIVLALLTFMPTQHSLFPHVNPYLLFLLILWPAFHFSARTISLAAASLAFVSLTSRAVWEGPSPFGGGSFDERLKEVELFLAIVTLSGFTFGAAFSELRRARHVAEERYEGQKAVERGLKESEERYRAILEGAGDGILLSDRSGRLVEANEAAIRLLGLESGHIAGKPLSSLFAADGKEADGSPGEALKTSSEKDVATMVNRNVLRPDGKRIEIEVNVRPLPSGQIVSVVRDLSRRRLDEKIDELRLRFLASKEPTAANSLFSAVIDEAEELTGSSIGFFHLFDDATGELTLTAWSSDTRAKMCERPNSDSHYPLSAAGIWADAIRLGRPVIHNDYPAEAGRKGLPPGHAPVHRELVVPVVHGGRVVAAMGVGNKATPYSESDIAPLVAFGALAWDLEDRSATQRLLVETEERFALVFRHSPVPTAITRADSGIIVDANEAFCRLFGYEIGEFVGRTTLDIGLYESPESRLEKRKRLSERERTLVWEPRLRTKDGRVLDTSTYEELVYVRGDPYLVSQIEDMTNRKQAEDLLRKTLAEKEILVRELYHRANNNMQVISALLDFQAASLGEEKLSRAIEDTQGRIGALALVNRKLFEAKDLSRINLRSYIEDLLDAFSQNERSSATIEIEKNLEDVGVLVDTAIPCGLILNELISNVYRHAYPDKTGVLMVELSRTPEKRIRLRVADRGVGLPPDFDIERNGKIGLQNIVGLCSSQLRGKVTFDRTKGLACEVVFSDDLYKARV